MVQTRRSKTEAGSNTKGKAGQSSLLPPLNSKQSAFSRSNNNVVENGRAMNHTNERGTSQTKVMPGTLPPLPLDPSSKKPPRKSMSATKTGPRTAHSDEISNREGKTVVSKVSENRHFLKGFNFDSCHDLLSIPDPPTPQANKTRNRRRQSTSFLKSTSNSALPLKDVTNGVIESNISSGSYKNSDEYLRNKKKRRSLCHVPSPDIQEPPQKKPSPEKVWQVTAKERQMEKPPGMAPMENEPSVEKKQLLTSGETAVKECPTRSAISKEEQPSIIPGKPSINENKPSEKETSGLRQQEWDLGDSEEEDDGRKHSSARKRSKRRQSIMLPSEDELKELSSSPSTGSKRTGVVAEDVANGQSQDSTSSSSFSEIQKLVRAYCSLPKGSAAVSEPAEKIRSMTGYSLPGPTTDSDPCGIPSTDMPDSQRRDLLVNIGPVLQLMDEQKVAQKEHAEQITGCRVEKTRSGKYRYRDASGKKVRPEDYKHRYLEMLNQQKVKKAEALKLCLQQLESHEEEQVCKSDEDQNELSIQHPTNSSVGANMYVGAAPVHEEEEGDDMDITNCSCDLGEIGLASLHSPLLLPNQSEEASKYASSATRSPTTLHHQNNDVQTTFEMVAESNKSYTRVTSTESDDLERDTSTSSEQESELPTNKARTQDTDISVEDDFMVPMPSRDGESSDPEIAKAERKLWETIDRALEVFSEEVLEIQTRRREEHAARRAVKGSHS